MSEKVIRHYNFNYVHENTYSTFLVSIRIYTCNLNENFSAGLTTFSPRAKDLLTKTQYPVLEVFLSVVEQSCPRDSQNIIDYFYCP